MKITFSKLLPLVISMSIVVSAFSQGPTSITNYAQAIVLAKTQNKVVLIDFTGSDWCEWCMKMKKEALDTPAFKHYAEKNLVIVEADFPRNKQQSAEVKAQNDRLNQEFKIAGYPAFVLLDKDGKELGRQEGYLKGGSSAFIAKLNTFYTPAPAASTATSGSDDFDKFFKKPAQSPTP